MPVGSKKEFAWQRTILAFASLAFLILGGLASTTDWIESGSKEFTSGTLLKVGVVLGLAWLAAPHLERLGWERVRGNVLLGLLIVLLLFAIRPKIGALAALVLIVSVIGMSLLGWVRRTVGPK